MDLIIHDDPGKLCLSKQFLRILLFVVVIAQESSHHKKFIRIQTYEYYRGSMDRM